MPRVNAARRDEEEVVNPELEPRDKNFRGQYSHARPYFCSFLVRQQTPALEEEEEEEEEKGRREERQ